MYIIHINKVYQGTKRSGWSAADGEGTNLNIVRALRKFVCNKPVET